MYLEKNLNAILIIILCGVLTSAYGVQFIYNEEPCPLCLLQRIAMISVASGAALNLYFGVHMSHYGLILLSAVAGGSVAIRQISLHICPGFPTFGIPILGLSLYTWSFIVFVCVVLYTAMLLILYDPKEYRSNITLNSFCKFSLYFLLLIAFSNIITTFVQCGFGVCSDT